MTKTSPASKKRILISPGAGLQQAISIDKATQQDYANINRDENEAASTEEQSLQVSGGRMMPSAVSPSKKKLPTDASNVDSFYGGYGGIYGGYGAYGGYGVVPHIHIHVYPQQ